MGSRSTNEDWALGKCLRAISTNLGLGTTDVAHKRREIRPRLQHALPADVRDIYAGVRLPDINWLWTWFDVVDMQNVRRRLEIIELLVVARFSHYRQCSKDGP
jgi:hypothetical protein